MSSRKIRGSAWALLSLLSLVFFQRGDGTGS